MAEELKIRVTLNNSIFSELKNLERKIQDFAKRVNQTLNANLNFNPNVNLGGTGTDVTAKIEKSIEKVNQTIKKTIGEVDRSIDDITKRIDKVFENIFVGLDNFFKFGRTLRLQIGSFFGNSQARLILLVNDATKIANIILPVLLKSVQALGKLEGGSTRLLRKLNLKGNVKDINSIIGKNKLPIVTEIRVFIDQLKKFLNEVIGEIRKITGLIRFVFNISDKEFSAISKKAKSENDKFKKGVDSVRNDVLKVFKEVQKRSGIIGKIFKGLFSVVTAPFKVALGLVKGLFGTISLLSKGAAGVFRLLTGRRKEPKQTGEEKKVSELQKERAEQSQKTLGTNKQITKEIAKLVPILEKINTTVGKITGSFKGFDFGKLEGSLKKSSGEALKNFEKIPNILIIIVRIINAVDSSVNNLDKTLKKVGEDVQKGFDVEKLKKFTQEIINAQRKTTVIKTAFGETKKKVDEAGKAVTVQLTPGVQKVTEEAKKANVQFETMKKVLIDVVTQAKGVDFSKFQALPKFNFGRGTAVFLTDIQRIFDALTKIQFAAESAFTPKAIESANKRLFSLTVLLAKLDGVLKNTNKEFETLGRTIEKIGIVAPKNIDEAKKAAQRLFEVFTGEQLLKRSQLKNFGNNIVRELGLAISQGDKAQFEKAIKELVNFLATFIPKNKRLIASGELIGKQLAKGMDNANKVVEKSSEKMADTVGDRFPQSLAKLGVLRKLPIAGKLIPTQLATAMIKNIGVLTNAATQLATAIFAPFKFAIEQIKNLAGGITDIFKSTITNAAQIGDISTTTGVAISEINKLDGVFREVGSTAKDNAIIFSRVQQTLNEINPDRETKLKQIGIDLDEIRASADPVVTLFEKTSDVLSRVPPGSKEAKLALEALGVTAQNKLVGVLRRGGDELQEIINQSSFFAGAVNSQVIQVSQELRSIFSNLGRIFDSIKADFIGEVLPVVRDFFDSVLQFFNDNADRIRQFTLFIGRAVANLFRVLVAFFKLLATEPKKAFDIFKRVFLALVTLVRKVVKSASERITKNLTDQVKFKFLAAFKGLKDSAFSILKLLGEQIDLRIAKALLSLENSLSDIEGFFLSVGGSFLGTTLKVAKRWITIALAVISEVAISIENFILNLRDRATIFFLRVKKDALQELEGLVDDIPEELRDFLGIGDFASDVSEIRKEISQIFKDIAARSSEDDFFTRVKNTIGDLNSEIESTDSLLDEVNKKLEESNARFGEDIAKNFSDAFSEAEKLLEAAGEATEGLFDEEAIKEYTQALEQAKSEIIDAVAGTEIEEPIKKLIDELSLSYLEKIKEMKDAAPDSLLPSVDADIEKVGSLGEALDGLIGVFRSVGSVVNNFAALFNSAFEATGRQSRALFFASKAAAAAQAVINGAVAFTEALKLPFPLNIIQPPLIAAKAGIQAGVIARQTIKGFAEGGAVPGEGGGDIVPAMLTPGEFVMPLQAVQSNGVAFMEAIRQGVVGAKDFAFSRLPSVIHSPTNRRFQDGGFVSSATDSLSKAAESQKMQIQPPQQTIVNVPDREMVGRFLSTEKGRDIILNVISDNAVEIKQLVGT